MAHRIAYIVSRFPKLSETFILREMIALEKSGWEVCLYPIILEKTKLVHAEAQPWLQRLSHYPWLSGKVIRANLALLFRSPFKYLSLWTQVILGNIKSPGFLIRAIMLFPKSVLIAEDLQEKKVTHIHAHFATHPAMAAWIMHQISGISYSITVHAHDIYVNRSMLEPKLRNASFIVAISDFNREFLARHYGDWVREKIKIVHCGIDTEVYSNLSGSGGSVTGKKTLVSIGSLQPYKGMQYLVNACAILKERGVSFVCKIIGEGEERKHLSELIARHGLEDHVELLGAKRQDEVAGLLREASCYVQPSVITETGKMEGIPVAMMEAMATNLPVIASKLSGIPELVRHGETGYLVPPGESQALADAIEYVLTHSAETSQIAASGRGMVRAEFDIYKNVNQLAELFSQKAGIN